MENKKRIHIGTSGWHYEHWRGPFYPKDLPRERFLHCYGNFVYIRLHGPGKAPYQGSYTIRDLSGWAGAFSFWANQGKEIFCYFDNDERGFAAQDALKLNKMIGKGEHMKT